MRVCFGCGVLLADCTTADAIHLCSKCKSFSRIYVTPDPRDATIAALRANLKEEELECARWRHKYLTSDKELAALRADLAEKERGLELMTKDRHDAIDRSKGFEIRVMRLEADLKRVEEERDGRIRYLERQTEKLRQENERARKDRSFAVQEALEANADLAACREKLSRYEAAMEPVVAFYEKHGRLPIPWNGAEFAIREAVKRLEGK